MSPTAIFMKKVQHINITAKKGSFKKKERSYRNYYFSGKYKIFTFRKNTTFYA